MLTLITLIVFSALIAVFATYNTAATTISLPAYGSLAIPTYLVVLASMLMGIVLASIISVINGVSWFMTVRNKDKTIHAKEHTVHDLEKRITELEAENAKLKTEHDTNHESVLRRPLIRTT